MSDRDDISTLRQAVPELMRRRRRPEGGGDVFTEVIEEVRKIENILAPLLLGGRAGKLPNFKTVAHRSSPFNSGDGEPVEEGGLHSAYGATNPPPAPARIVPDVRAHPRPRPDDPSVHARVCVNMSSHALTSWMRSEIAGS